jgi:hypothetical protein
VPGHQAIDEALSQSGQRLAMIVGGEDIVMRSQQMQRLPMQTSQQPGRNHLHSILFVVAIPTENPMEQIKLDGKQ